MRHTTYGKCDKKELHLFNFGWPLVTVSFSRDLTVSYLQREWEGDISNSQLMSKSEQT